jgi:DNA topoisomerase-1
MGRRDVATPSVTPMSDPVEAAQAAARATGLRYATDSRPGIARVRSGRGFSYRDADGATITDPLVRKRITALAIPPAWTDVWICPWPNGHLQATGRDARGRKQYRYHVDWGSRRGAEKFDRVLEFARVLPRVRRRVDGDLRKHGLPREKVLAAVVRLLELTLIRVGNDEYARLNRSFGLTTLRDRHATVTGDTIRFRFRSKSGVMHESGLRDRRLAGIVRKCQDLPGQELFQYVDDEGAVRDVASDDVNAYLRDASGGDFTAKDVRTWAGTVLAFRALRALTPVEHEPAARRNLLEAIRIAADGLGNTPAVARGSYVHPAVTEAYLEGELPGSSRRAVAPTGAAVVAATTSGLPDRAEELALIRLLRERVAAGSKRSASGKRG